jgi:hypothetical protein
LQAAANRTYDIAELEENLSKIRLFDVPAVRQSFFSIE